MNKKVALLLTLFIVLISLQSRTVSADFFKLPKFPLLLPSATPTPKIFFVIPSMKIPLITLHPLSPSSTPIPPSATPIPATSTPIPPTVTETPMEVQNTEEVATQDISPTATSPLNASPSAMSPTPSQQKGGLSQMEMILGGVGGVFGIVILVLLWPKMKQFIHNKNS